MKANWILRNKKADVAGLSRSLNLNPAVVKLLVNRGYTERFMLEQFFDCSIERLHQPAQLLDCDKAAAIVIAKLEQQAPIRIVGDYDVDGVISTFLLYQSLSRLGAKISYVIPHRVADGYGINRSIIEQAVRDGIDTIITCDNGIAAIDAIDYGKQQGLTIIVTDHHNIPYRLAQGQKEYLRSQADAIINPKQIECQYPESEICGATVAYKLIQRIYQLQSEAQDYLLDLLQYVAIATVCDVMELVGENRVLVTQGLQRLRDSDNQGLQALAKASGIELNQVKAYHLGFVLGPCLNAAGRLESAEKGLRLLLGQGDVTTLATELVELNNQRKKMTQDGVAQAIDTIENNRELSLETPTGQLTFGRLYQQDKVLVLYLAKAHESIAGIIAGRIREKYGKPTFVLTPTESGLKGSGRSIEGYSMADQLIQCDHWLVKYGGHKMAAGLSLQPDQLSGFTAAINQNCTLTDQDLIPNHYIDTILPFRYINQSLIEDMNRLEPFGKGNPKPVFGLKQVVLKYCRLVGANNKVIQMKLEDETGFKINGVYFGEPEYFFATLIQKYDIMDKDEIIGRPIELEVDISFYPDRNEYKGNHYYQVIVENIR